MSDGERKIDRRLAFEQQRRFACVEMDGRVDLQGFMRRRRGDTTCREIPLRTVSHDIEFDIMGVKGHEPATTGAVRQAGYLDNNPHSTTGACPLQ